jgi:hypothetical protein
MVGLAPPHNASGDEGVDGRVVAIDQPEASSKNQPKVGNMLLEVVSQRLELAGTGQRAGQV